RRAWFPRHRRQRRPDEASVRQSLRHGSVDDRRNHPRDQRAAASQAFLRGRFRLGRPPRPSSGPREGPDRDLPGVRPNACAEGHPALVMDMSFANQALSAEYAIQNAAELERKVYPVPEEIDKEIARLKLATMGVEIDTLTEEQQKYLASWDEGT